MRVSISAVMNNNFSEWSGELCGQRRVQPQSTLHPQCPGQIPVADEEPSRPAQPDWTQSPWFAEWKRLAGISS
jgi:hypothetical protein